MYVYVHVHVQVMYRYIYRLLYWHTNVAELVYAVHTVGFSWKFDGKQTISSIYFSWQWRDVALVRKESIFIKNNRFIKTTNARLLGNM